MENAKDIMRKMLGGFVNDPPDTDFQRGFLEGLVVFAHEGLGLRLEDQTFKLACDLAYEEVDGSPQPPARKRFMVIDGGKADEAPAPVGLPSTQSHEDQR